MFFSAPTQYAFRSLGELVLRAGSGRLLLDDILKGTDLPRDYVAKIFQTLVQKDILNSVRGRNGGFSIARPAHDITLMQIVTALEGPQALDTCVVGLTACNDHMPCVQHDLYKPIRQRLKDYLATTTLADLSVSLKAKLEALASHSKVQKSRD